VAAALVAQYGGGGKPTRQVVRTVTARGDTVTVTAAAPTTAAAETTTAAAETTAPAETTTPAEATTTQPATTAAAPSSGSGLNDAAYRKMQAGDYRGALPLLEQATQTLAGTGSLAEAYALYNLAFTRFALGSCAGVTELLDRSQQIQGHRKEIDNLRKQAKKSCR
jgi:hypothetical protein